MVFWSFHYLFARPPRPTPLMNKKTLQRTLETALEFHRSGQHDEAEKLYAQVRHGAPKLYDGWYLSGTLAFQRGGHLEEAVTYLTRAQRLDPQAAQCKLFLGMALADLGRHGEAEKSLRAAVQKLPNYPDAWQNLARCESALGRRSEAVESVQRALALAPDRADLREQLDTLQRGPDEFQALSDALSELGQPIA